MTVETSDDLVGREAAAAGVLEEDVLVRRHVDAVDLVVGDVALQPADLGPEVADHLVGLLADVVQSSADSFPAPGSSRSITYFGMVVLPVVVSY